MAWRIIVACRKHKPKGTEEVAFLTNLQFGASPETLHREELCFALLWENLCKGALLIHGLGRTKELLIMQISKSGFEGKALRCLKMAKVVWTSIASSCYENNFMLV